LPRQRDAHEHEVGGDTACRVPACRVPACRVHIEQAVKEGRLLAVSPFDGAVEAPSARRAVWCNQYVLAHCDRLVVGHLNPGGMLECILAEADPEKEIVFL